MGTGNDGGEGDGGIGNALGALRATHPDALAAVRRILEARADSALARLSELELRHEVCRTYVVLARIVEAVEAEILGAG